MAPPSTCSSLKSPNHSLMKSSNYNASTFLPASLFFGIMLLASSFSQAQQIFMSVEGVTQGDISLAASGEVSLGDKAVAAHVNEMVVLSLEHTIVIPRDAQSGQPSGNRLHQPVKVTCYLDKATPLMQQALVTGESLAVKVKFYRTNSEEPGASDEHYYTIALEGAIVTMSRMWVPASDPEKRQLVEYQLSYSTITWTHEVADTEGNDDWRTSGG
jgi:type VI secretion system secreted protein Hcp